MVQFITPERKGEIIMFLQKLIKDLDEKCSLYNEIHQYVDELEARQVPRDAGTTYKFC
jgi:hypothetical protein